VWTVIHSRFAEARNAMDPDSAEALAQAFREFDADDSASVAVLWGEGGAFCAGWDLKFASTLSDRDAFQRHVVDGLAFPTGANPAPRGPLGPTRLELSKPVIAAVEGPAVAGGMELALWCDIRVMAESAYFGVYCRRWGIPLLDGGSVRLARLVGQGRAMEIILTGRKVPADEALRIGMCEQVVETGGARAAAEAMAREIAAPWSRRMVCRSAKRCGRNGPTASRPSSRKAPAAPRALPAARAATAISRRSDLFQGSRTWPKSFTSATAASRASR
jgi:enoyl-CoA hydratase